MSDSVRHPDDNVLAALAEGHDVPEAAAVREHLAHCRTCLAAYAEAVRWRDLALREPGAGSPPPGLAAAGLAAGRPAGRPRALRWAWAPALAAAVLLVALLPRHRGGGLDAEHLATIRGALQERSTAGLVYPGVDLSPTTVYRSGGENGPALAAAVRDIAEATGGDETPRAAAAYWLAAGYLAGGQVGAATDLLRRARLAHPDDRDLLVLDGIASYRRSDLARAEQLLRRALDESPGDAVVRFDLAVVLVDAGRIWEARQLLDGGDWSGDTALARRVHALRDTLRATGP